MGAVSGTSGGGSRTTVSGVAWSTRSDDFGYCGEGVTVVSVTGELEANETRDGHSRGRKVEGGGR